MLTSWNALMIDAYADAYAAFGDAAYIRKALAISGLIEKKMLNSDGHLWRSYAQGKASIDGFLDDYAFTVKAYIHLYQVTFNKDFLLRAEKIVAYATQYFFDAKSGLFNYST